MTQRVRVFTRNGVPIGQVDAAVIMTWKLSKSIEVNRGELTMSLRDPKATAGFLRYTNLVFVETTGGIPAWCGIIWPPTTIRDGKITVNLLACEYLLGYRMTGVNQLTQGTPGAIFRQLVHIACGGDSTSYRLLPIDISTASIDPSGQDMKIRYDYEVIYEMANQLAEDTLSYWWFVPKVDAANKLYMQPVWSKRKGRRFGTQLIENVNLNNVEVTQGDAATGIGTRIKAWTSADWDDPKTAELTSKEGATKYGLIDSPLPCLDADTQLVSYRMRRALAEKAWPRINITATITRPPFPRAGDRLEIIMPTSGGFLMDEGTRGMNVSYRLKECSYDPVANVMEINCSEIVFEEFD